MVSESWRSEGSASRIVMKSDEGVGFVMLDEASRKERESQTITVIVEEKAEDLSAVRSSTTIASTVVPKHQQQVL